MIRQDSQDTQTERRASKTCENAALKNAHCLNLANGTQVDLQALERSIIDRVRSEVDSKVATVERRVHDEMLSSMESFVIPRVHLAIKSVNASYGQDAEKFILDPDERIFSGNIESLQLTTWNRINSNPNLNRVD